MKIAGPLNRVAPKVLIAVGLLILVQQLLNAAGFGIHVRVHSEGAANPAVNVGDKVRRTFRLTNYSLSPVEVRAEPSCGCTLLDAAGTWLPPLSSRTIHAEVSTEGLAPGQYRKAVQLRFETGRRKWEEVESIQFSIR